MDLHLTSSCLLTQQQRNVQELVGRLSTLQHLDTSVTRSVRQLLLVQQQMNDTILQDV